MTNPTEIETTAHSAAEASLDAAVEDLKNAPKGLEEGPIQLPPVAITKYVLHDTFDPWFQNAAEPYLVGIAVDSSLKPVKIPWGLDIVDPAKFRVPGAGVESAITFGNEDGAVLVLPPVNDFLALVLMVADSDNAKGTSEVLKAISELASNADLIKLVAGANLTAAGVLAAVGSALNIVVKGIENNRDDIIAIFAVYFGPSKLVPGPAEQYSQPGADIWLKVLPS